MNRFITGVIFSLSIISCGNGSQKKSLTESKSISIVQFLKDNKPLSVSHDFFYRDLEFNENFESTNYLKDISEIEYTTNKIQKQESISASDTIKLDSIDIVLGKYGEIVYQFEKYENSINSFVVSFESCEGYGYIIINKTTKCAQITENYPIISNDAKKFITFRNEGDHEIVAMLSFYDINSGIFTKKFVCKGKNLQVEDVFWKDNTNIFIKFCNSKREERYGCIDINALYNNLSKKEMITYNNCEIYLEKDNSRSTHLFINKGNNIKTEIIKPNLEYEIENKTVSEKVVTNSELKILKGDSSDLIWIFGENEDGGKPNYSALYDLSGTLLSFKYTLRISSTEMNIISAKGDFDKILTQYGISNFQEQANDEKLPTLNLGIW